MNFKKLHNLDKYVYVCTYVYNHNVYIVYMTASAICIHTLKSLVFYLSKKVDDGSFYSTPYQYLQCG